MKKLKDLFLPSMATLGVGAIAIFGNAAIVSQVMADNIGAENSVIISASSPMNVSEIENEIVQGYVGLARPTAVSRLREGVQGLIVNRDRFHSTTESSDVLRESLIRFHENDERVVFGQHEARVILRTLPEYGMSVAFLEPKGDNEARATLTRSDGSISQLYEGELAEALMRRFDHLNADIQILDGGLGDAARRKIAYRVQNRHNVRLFETGEPGAYDIALEEAIDIAIKALVERYALNETILDRFNIDTAFLNLYQRDSSVWKISLEPNNVLEFSEIGTYSAFLDSRTGEVVRLLSAADGRG